ncbi:MAG: sugar transferase [Lachnospiraceae bacterium]|nr:sugar transferase [Lachnospiraceae bacterium]
MERKSITNTAKTLIVIWNMGLFIGIWFGFYNNYTFDRYRMLGGVLSCVVYSIIYLFLCQLYKTFRIASMSIGETVISQVLCLGIADFVLYAECCLIYNRMVNLLPGIITALGQIAGTVVLVIVAKNYLMKHLIPQKTVVIYGKEIERQEINEFSRRLLKKYKHLFQIGQMLSEKEITFSLEETVSENATVLLYEVSHLTRKKVMKYALEHKKNIYFTPTIEDITLQGCTEKHLLDTPLMKYDYVYESISEYTGKRFFDVVMSFLMLCLCSPFMLLAAIAIKLEDRGPVFYKQKRCTKNGVVFEIIKFRSMIVDAEKNGFLPCTAKDNRITNVGNFLRKTRMDELPQLINILKGDMSFVGPRPERVEHVEKYTKELPEFEYRMRVKGGLTGYAQIYGKYNTSAYDKLRLDLTYIENQSFLLDLKMILLTLKIIFISESTEGFTEEKSRNISGTVEKRQGMLGTGTESVVK